jgi:hypothetical protein
MLTLFTKISVVNVALITLTEAKVNQAHTRQFSREFSHIVSELERSRPGAPGSLWNAAGISPPPASSPRSGATPRKRNVSPSGDSAGNPAISSKTRSQADPNPCPVARPAFPISPAGWARTIGAMTTFPAPASLPPRASAVRRAMGRSSSATKPKSSSVLPPQLSGRDPTRVSTVFPKSSPHGGGCLSRSRRLARISHTLRRETPRGRVPARRGPDFPQGCSRRTV